MNPMQSENNVASKSRRRRKKSKKPIIVIICLLVALFGCIAFGAYYYSRSLLNQVERDQIDESDLGIKEEVKNELEGTPINNIVNVALFGIDGSFDDSVQHSDSTMVATFDPVHKKLKITSIMRDSYVDIPGYGKDKFTHAFAYGGPQLTIKTINQNFNLNITDYVSIDYNELQKVVDCLGGVDLEMTDEEYNYLTYFVATTGDMDNMSTSNVDDPIEKNPDGTYHLNGYQALGYARIRDLGRSDFDRTERQRKLLSVVFKKISNAGKGELASLAVKILPSIKTSMTDKEIMNLAFNILNLGTKNLESERFPRDEYCNDDNTLGGMYILSYDEEYTAEQFSKYIFEDKKLWNEDNQKVYVEREYGVPKNAYSNGTYYGPDDNTNNGNSNTWDNTYNSGYANDNQNSNYNSGVNYNNDYNNGYDDGYYNGQDNNYNSDDGSNNGSWSGDDYNNSYDPAPGFDGGQDNGTETELP